MKRVPPDAAGAPRPGAEKKPSRRLAGRLGREMRTMTCMVRVYCRDHHATGGRQICPACEAFLAYAGRRLEKCPYGNDKPTCANCPIHCYKPAPREFAREMMGYAGPRMTFRHPWLALLHLLDSRREVEHPMETRRGRRQLKP